VLSGLTPKLQLQKTVILILEIDFFNNFGKRPPVYAPFTAPLYSNIGTTLLGLVIETATNQTYQEWIQRSILNPIGMNRTFLSRPADSLGFIPINATDWPVELGVEAPYVCILSLLTHSF
jgi:CubicO group peptidase (beta-lactamase class C family)